MTTIRILLVEDNREFANLVELFLRKHEPEKFEVTWKDNGAAALELLETDRAFQVILMDYFLPGKNGLEITKLIQEKGYDLPIIFLTVNKDFDLAVEVMKLGVEDYLVKEEISTPGAAACDPERDRAEEVARSAHGAGDQSEAARDVAGPDREDHRRAARAAGWDAEEPGRAERRACRGCVRVVSEDHPGQHGPDREEDRAAEGAEERPDGDVRAGHQDDRSVGVTRARSGILLERHQLVMTCPV